MPYVVENSYYFRPYYGNSNFWLNRQGSGVISNHQNANLYTATGNPDQRLKIHIVPGGCQLQSDLNHAYGLNIYRSTKNCDFFPVAGNETDALIDLLTVDASAMLYRIKLINHNLFLTPSINSINANLSWQADSGTNNQVWKLSTTQDSAPISGYTYPTVSRILTQAYKENVHRGIDIKTGPGANIFSFADGVVSFVQKFDKNIYNNPAYPPGCIEELGNAICINHINPNTDIVSGKYAQTVYMHLQENPSLKAGDHVTIGQIIGKSGDSGRANGAHLHFNLAVGNASFLTPGYIGYTSMGSIGVIDPCDYLFGYN